MSESSDKPDAEEAAALLKTIAILWDAMPDEGKDQVRQQHSDVADAAEHVANLVRQDQRNAQGGEQEQKDAQGGEQEQKDAQGEEDEQQADG